MNKIVQSKIKSLKDMLKPNNLPRLLLLLACLLLLYYVYSKYLKEGFELKPTELEDEIQSGKKLVLFYADWCGHCKKIKPVWDETAEEINKDDKKMIKVNCGEGTNEEKKIMKEYNIDGYPTIILFNNGKPEPYSGERTKDGFIEALS